MRVLRSRRFLRLLLIGSLAIAALVGLVISRSTVHAASKATYTVLAGMDSPYGIVANAFGPQTVKVHRGDTITWKFLSFHDVHFDQKPADLVVMSTIDGKKMPEFNPAIAFPTMKSGDPYRAGAGTGVPLAAPQPPGAPPPTFSVLMDVEPGTYTYVCDVHPGMIGIITVVDDMTEIPGPAEVEKQGQAEMEATLAGGDKAYLALLKKFPPLPQGDTLKVSAGGQEGTASLLLFFPMSAHIQVGQSVTWTIPQGFEPHTINFPLPSEGRPSELGFLMDSQKQMHIVPTDILAPNVKTGGEVPANGAVKSGLLIPGQSLTLKFTKPGAYAYFCALHENMFGTIIVDPPLPQRN